MFDSKIKKIEIPETFPDKIPDNILKAQNSENSEIKNFDKYAILLTLKFIKSSIESINCYSNLSFVLAIDCCETNEIEDKLINFLLLISLCKCLYYLEIPFSIMIFSDYKFQYIIHLSFRTIEKVLFK